MSQKPVGSNKKSLVGALSFSTPKPLRPCPSILEEVTPGPVIPTETDLYQECYKGWPEGSSFTTEPIGHNETVMLVGKFFSVPTPTYIGYRVLFFYQIPGISCT
jgi:hypothetical protein